MAQRFRYLWFLAVMIIAQPLSANLTEDNRDQTEQQISYDHVLQSLQQQLQHDPSDYEAQLLQGLVYLKKGNLDQAIAVVASLRSKVPTFHLAHVVYGDLLMMRSGNRGEIGILQANYSEQQLLKLNNLRSEMMSRVETLLQQPAQTLYPRALLHMSDSINTAIVVDKQANRLYQYRWNRELQQPELVTDYYVSTGKLMGNKSSSGDLKTPEGVYFITSHIPDDKLPEKYGISAYPMNYPNEYDKHLRKSGYGIWLHGTDPIYYSRPPLDNEGCVVLPNIDLSKVAQSLQTGKTPIIVTDSVQWLSKQEWSTLRHSIRQSLEQWRRDWESGEVNRYLQHYDSGFWSEKGDIQQWSKHKRRVAQSKTYQKISLDDLSFFAYPATATGEMDMVVANFTQDYQSNNYSQQSNKRVYLSRKQGGSEWKIIYEGMQ